MKKGKVSALIQEISQCTLCKNDLQLGPRPVFAFNHDSKILIIGQAPGLAVHRSGIPWQDKSGDRLREWLGVNEKQFYDPSNFGIIPMGFCYPGKAKSGDAPPRPECAPQWHKRILDNCKQVKLTLLIGNYAQKYYLRDSAKKNLTETVRHYQEYLPAFLPMPHPSPRNNIWLKKNLWFKDILQDLRLSVHNILKL